MEWLSRHSIGTGMMCVCAYLSVRYLDNYVMGNMGSVEGTVDV